MKNAKLWLMVAIAAAASVVAAMLIVGRKEGSRDATPVTSTVGDIRAVHADVTVSEREVRGERRLRDGDQVKTGESGRARVRLDDGTLVAVAGSTQFSVRGNQLTLTSGRIFVQGGAAARTEVTLAAAKTTVSSSAAAFERRSEGDAKIYCANGELILSLGARQTRVTSGETASLAGGEAKVLPETAFDDWTGGLAVPWAGEVGERSAIAELRGGSGAADPGTPLVVRSHVVDTRIDGELALTRTRTTYFNGSSGRAGASVRLALPAGALVTRVARRTANLKEDDVGDLRISTLLDPAASLSGDLPARIEWAGAGWLRGEIGEVGAGETVELVLEYTEWLPTRKGEASYRFPMAAGSELIGELRADVDLTRTGTTFVSVNAGASVEERVVKIRRADLRPSADLVVELAPKVVQPGSVRAYVAPGKTGEDPYVMLRTEVPEKTEAGVTLAVVLDASMSIGAATLETERAVLDAILEGLGPRDSLVVLAMDQAVRPVGKDTPAPVTPELRAEIKKLAGGLRPGGASNLGLALQRAADVLDAPSRGESAGTGMVVYIGDGRPTVGETAADAIRRSIRRRAGGLPRLSAVAVGPGADRWMLAELTAGAGTVYEVFDPPEAARAGAAMLADALEPTLRDVELALGPDIDRIYPREARAALAGSTVTVLGRLRGKLPAKVGLRFRDGGKLVDESRAVRQVPLPAAADLPRRWAMARIEEMAARDDGIESAIALADSAELLTPWTSFFFGPTTRTPAFAVRVLELSPEFDTALAARVEEVLEPGSTLLEPAVRNAGSDSLAQAAEAAVRRQLEQAAAAVRACRDARAAVRPEIPRSFVIDVAVDGGGRATRVQVAVGERRESDRVLERCIRSVVESLPYAGAGTAVKVNHTLTVPEGRSSRRTQCSEVSKLAVPLRKGIWRARQVRDANAYVAAARACELGSWTDRRAFLLLLLERVTSGEERLSIAAELDAAGETDAAAFVRRETLRRVSSFSKLEELSRALVRGEPAIDGELDKAYRKAKTDTERLDVVRRFLLLAPHNVLAKSRLLSLLEALGQRDALVREISLLRAEPFADAGLLAEAASALRRIGLEAEGRRALSELIERAPRDPWTIAYVGDRLRAEGLFDEATAAYASLSRMLPNEAAVLLRMALAHAGAGRLDVATRLLDKVTQTGGRADEGRLGELASITSAVLLAGARGKADPKVEAELERRLMRTALPDVAGVVLIQSPPSDRPVEVRIARDDREQEAADFNAAALGVSALRIERGAGPARILISRPADPGPSRPARVRVAALVLAGDRSPPRLVTREVNVLPDGEAVELRFDGASLL